MVRFSPLSPFGALALVGLLLVPCAHAQSPSPGLPTDLDAFVKKTMEEWRVPGLAIAVIKDGEVILQKGYGMREVGRPESVDAETLFAIGSTTKAFTSAAIGTLVDAGKMEWDTPVTKLWPEFKLSDPWVTKEIRVSDLMANHSGLSALSEMLWYGTGFDRAKIMERLELVPIDEGFRYRFQYRNVMFLAAGELIPRVDGRSWDDYIFQVLLKPLNMKRSFPTQAGIEKMENVAQPHVIDYNGAAWPVPYRDMHNIGPAGSIISCVTDLANWMQMQLSLGEFDGKTILKPETLAFIHRSQTPLGTTGPNGAPLSPPMELPAYCLSWVTQSYRGTRIVWHNGGIDGMSAWIGLLPDDGIGVVILTNLESADLRKAVFYHVIDALTGKTPLDLEPQLLKDQNAALAARDAAEKSWMNLAAKPLTPPLPLKEFAGTYQSPILGDVRIELQNGGLVYFRTPEQTLDLVYSAGNKFIAKYRNAGEDLRSGKIDIDFTIKDDAPVSFLEENLATYDRVK